MDNKESDKSLRKVFDEMFTEHYPSLFRYGKRMVTDPVLVEDAIQNVFVRLWEKRNKLDIKSHSAYLLVSLRREILHMKDKDNRETSHGYDAGHEVEIFFTDEDFIEEKESRGMLNKRISSILNRLSSRQREIIYLHFYEEKSYRDIAEILDVNYQSVVNNLHRAFSKIRKMEGEQKWVK